MFSLECGSYSSSSLQQGQEDTGIQCPIPDTGLYQLQIQYILYRDTVSYTRYRVILIMDTIYILYRYTVFCTGQDTGLYQSWIQYILYRDTVSCTGYRVILIMDTIYSLQIYTVLYRIKGYINHGYNIFYTGIQCVL